MRARDLLASLALAALVAACGKTEPTPPAAPHDHAHEHGAHGGHLLELGKEEGHVELVHDPKAKDVTAYVLGKDGKTPVKVAAPTIVLSTKEGMKELTMTAVSPAADGTSDTWKAAHPAFELDPLNGRIRVTIDGKTHQSPLEPDGHQ